jgi:hypothetical protein
VPASAALSRIRRGSRRCGRDIRSRPAVAMTAARGCSAHPCRRRAAHSEGKCTLALVSLPDSVVLTPLAPTALHALGQRHARLSIGEGCSHQVRACLPWSAMTSKPCIARRSAG